jgi:hypothetical protein
MAQDGGHAAGPAIRLTAPKVQESGASPAAFSCLTGCHWRNAAGYTIDAVSWDIFVQDLPPGVRNTSEIPDDFHPQPLGRRDDIIARIREIFPTADFTDPSWGRCETAHWSIEFNMGETEICSGFALHVRGGGDAAAAIARLLDHLGLPALDTASETGIFDKAAAEAGFLRWQAYRDQVIGR